MAVIIDHVKDEDGDGAANITDVALFLKRNKAARTALKGDPDNYPGGDFRSAECVAFLKQADIVVTNPPFSLFREYVAQLVEHGKKFLIIGSKNAITYKEIFPLIKQNEMWVGAGFAKGNAYFSIPADRAREFANGVYDKKTGLVKFRNVGWFTNLDHGRRHEKLKCMSTADNLKFSKHKKIQGKKQYDRYDNYDAIEVPYTDAIPSDHDGAMGVPISFLDRYNPDQFVILGITDRDDNSGLKTKEYSKADTPKFGDLNRRGAIRVGGELVSTYARLMIRHRKPTKGKKK